MDIDAYLARISYEGPRDAKAATLAALHRAHLYAVPFENLDIHAGREIVLEEARLLDKVVRQRRGGFCYELNGAFAALLRALGFDVTLLSARVANDRGGFGPEFDHLTLRVVADGVDWLADVGFGECYAKPILLRPGLDQERDGTGYRVAALEDGVLALEQRDAAGKWQAKHLFSLTPRRLEDFSGMCRHHQSSPESHFTQSTVCTIAVPGGRVTLSGRRLIEAVDGRREERELASDAEVAEALRERFGVVL